jgi:hypothetical protein
MIGSLPPSDFVEEAFRRGEISARRKSILIVLVARFGPAAEALEVELQTVEYEQFKDLVPFAVNCRNLASFRKRLLS